MKKLSRVVAGVLTLFVASMLLTAAPASALGRNCDRTDGVKVCVKVERNGAKYRAVARITDLAGGTDWKVSVVKTRLQQKRADGTWRNLDYEGSWNGWFNSWERSVTDWVNPPTCRNVRAVTVARAGVANSEFGTKWIRSAGVRPC